MKQDDQCADMGENDRLKIAALDEEDLSILSAHVQDAILRVADLTYLPNQNRMAIIANRFNWARALGYQPDRADGNPIWERRRCILHFDRVLSVKTQEISPRAKGKILSLMALKFIPETAPAGYIDLLFAGGGTLRLQVECIEARLTDLAATWESKRRPDHALPSEMTAPTDGKPD